MGLIRRLTIADLPACQALAADRQWPPEDRKWRFLFEIGEVYGLEEPGEGLVGTVVLTRYEPSAAISMVLVAARREGRGLGRRLMKHAIERAGSGPVSLYATPIGRPLYEKLGFEAIGEITIHTGRLRAPQAHPISRPASEADLERIAELDAAVVGADRSRLVAGLPAFAEQLRVVERDGRIAGYAGAWDNVDHIVIGPVVAENAALAQALIADLAAGVDGPIRLDVDRARPELLTWAGEHGLTPGFSSVLMVLDGRPLGGDRSRLFVPVMQALG
jgi:GNAT superfamily N-acetyltransferase